MVKGKRRPVIAFAVGDARRTRAESPQCPSDHGCRRRARVHSTTSFRRVKDGAGHVIEIVGDHGSGKTRLVEELRRRTPELSVLRASPVRATRRPLLTHRSGCFFGRCWASTRRPIARRSARRLSEVVERTAPEMLPCAATHRNTARPGSP